MNRFELEMEIMNLYSVSDSMRDISTGILEHDINRDEAVNAIVGLSVITNIKIDKILDKFAQVFCLDEYKDCVNDLDDNYYKEYSDCESPSEWF